MGTCGGEFRTRLDGETETTFRTTMKVKLTLSMTAPTRTKSSPAGAYGRPAAIQPKCYCAI